MYTISHLFALLLVLGFSRAAERVLPPAGSVLMKSIVVDNSNLPPPKPAATAPTNGPLDWSQIHLDTKICRKNTAGSVVAADNSFLTVIFDDVKTDIGGGDFKVASTGSICSAALQLESPGGYKLKIDSADYRGYYNLNKGVTGMIRTLYEFKGEGRQYLLNKTIAGPVTTDFLFHQPGELTPKGVAPCGRTNTTMIITIEVSLSTVDPNAIGAIYADTADAHFSQILNLAWEKC